MLRSFLPFVALLGLLACASTTSVGAADTSTSPPAAKMCGGIAGLQCGGAKEYCSYADGACHTPDAAGTCKPKPEMCPMIYAPVCGCDGKTYSNDCVAHAAGASVAANGACTPQ